MDPTIKAVALIAPVLAPLAVKIIDKLIFIEPPQQQNHQQQIQGSQIIKISTPKQCNCQKKRSNSVTSDSYDDSSASCSTCSTCYSSTGSSEMSGSYKYVSKKNNCLIPPIQKHRSSSISGKSSLSVENDKSKQKSRGHRSSSDSRISTELKKSHNNQTLDILADKLLKKETALKKSMTVSKGKENIEPKKKFSQYRGNESSINSPLANSTFSQSEQSLGSTLSTKKITTSSSKTSAKKSSSCCCKSNRF